MDSRTKILNAASQLFLNGGVSKLSVRAISAEAGLSTIGIYSHFQGKQGILDALYIEGFDLVHDAMDVVSDGDASREQVLQCCRGYLQVAEQREAHYRLIFGESDSGYQPSPEAVAARDRAFSKLVRVAGSYLGDQASALERHKIALDVWAIAHGYVSISHHVRGENEQPWDWKTMALNAIAVQLDAIAVSRSA